MEGLFDKLEKEKGSSLTEKEKEKVLEHLDIEKSPDGFYLDSFGKQISYNGIKTLKKPYTKLSLTEIHINEIKKCSEDMFYFIRNYCRILTKDGVSFPEFRQYQLDFLETLNTPGDVIASLPRQCIEGSSIIEINNSKTSIKDFFEEYKDGPNRLNDINSFSNDFSFQEEYPCKIIESYKCEDKYISTPIGEVEILEVHKTIEYDIFKITLENGLELEGSELHTLITSEGKEVYLKDSLNRNISTIYGSSKVISKVFIKRDHCYDLTLKDYHLYYSNGILSHNSGKSVSCGLYILWYALFNNDKTIGICANNVKLAMEVLDKVKKIFVLLPIWMQQGLESWNKGSISFENNTRILTSAGNSDAFRGFSCNIILVDELAFVNHNDWQGIVDSVIPSQAALTDRKFIGISTPNGMNHWFHLVNQAKKENSSYNFFTCDWKEVPRYNKDGSRIDPEKFKEEQIRKNGKKHFAQNFELAFLGSSSTLIDEEALKSMEYIDENEVIFNSLFYGLRIIEEPLPNHNYIIGVDPKKDGVDKLAMQVLDVTNLPFRQVASCNLNDSYLTAPGKIFDLGCYYNNAMIVVENNIDNSIVDTLFYQYEYEGEIFKEKDKNILGFRTTTKTKKILLSLLKKLIEENKLIIKDKETIDEFFTFIEQKNGSFSADEGLHDDLVMACMIALAPFIDIKSFDDFKGFITLIEKRNEELEALEAETELFYSLGFSTEMVDEEKEEDPEKFMESF